MYNRQLKSFFSFPLRDRRKRKKEKTQKERKRKKEIKKKKERKREREYKLEFIGTSNFICLSLITKSLSSATIYINKKEKEEGKEKERNFIKRRIIQSLTILPFGHLAIVGHRWTCRKLKPNLSRLVTLFYVPNNSILTYLLQSQNKKVNNNKKKKTNREIAHLKSSNIYLYSIMSTHVNI